MCESLAINKITAINKLDEFSHNGRYVFHLRDFGKLFPEESDRALKASIQRLVANDILTRAVYGVYVYNHAMQDGYILEHIVRTLRRCEYSYVSLERQNVSPVRHRLPVHPPQSRNSRAICPFTLFTASTSPLAITPQISSC